MTDVHWLDVLYANRQAQTLFGDGWGDESLLDQLEDLSRARPVPQPVAVRWEEARELSGRHVRRGTFESPAADGLPAAAQQAVVWEVAPLGCLGFGPAAVLMAATGDEGPELRRFRLAAPLAAKGVRSLILENPFYGERRPPGQVAARLRRASDLCAMFRAAAQEGAALVATLAAEGEPGRCVAGISMGGQAAAMVGALSRTPVAVAACLAPASGTAPFLDGLLGRRVDWGALGPGDDAEVVARFRRRVLDPGDLVRQPLPERPDLAILVGGRADGFVPPDAVERLHRHWSGSEVRWVEGGHVSAMMVHGGVFVTAILDALRRTGGLTGHARLIPR